MESYVVFVNRIPALKYIGNMVFAVIRGIAALLFQDSMVHAGRELVSVDKR